jgi:hypothetical protein
MEVRKLADRLHFLVGHDEIAGHPLILFEAGARRAIDRRAA